MQRRGGLGKKGMNTRDEDFVTNDLRGEHPREPARLHRRTGKVFYPLNVYELPGGRPRQPGAARSSTSLPLDPDGAHHRGGERARSGTALERRRRHPTCCSSPARAS
jgi:hypothetical protein